MKALYSITLLTLLFSVVLFAGEKKTVDLKIDGMTCGACVQKVKSAIEKVEGVTEANVVLASNSATVTYESAKADEAKISKAVNDTGYKVVKEHSKTDGEGKACCDGSGECCKDSKKEDM